MNDNAEKSKFGMSTCIVIPEDYNCDIFKPVGGDPIFMHLDGFQPAISSDQYSKANILSLELLSKIWKIDNDKASKVLYQNTQLKLQIAYNDISCQLSTNNRMLRYRRINSQLFTHNVFARMKGNSNVGNTCEQTFVSDKGFVDIYPMWSKGDFQDYLQMFCENIGVTISLAVKP